MNGRTYPKNLIEKEYLNSLNKEDIIKQYIKLKTNLKDFKKFVILITENDKFIQNSILSAYKNIFKNE